MTKKIFILPICLSILMMGFLSFYYKAQAIEIDITGPDLSTISITIDRSGQNIPKGTSATIETGKIVSSIQATLTESSTIVTGTTGDITMTGPFPGSTTNTTLHFGTFIINNGNTAIITPDEGNDKVKYPGTFIFTIAPGTIQDLSNNLNNEINFQLIALDYTKPEAIIKYSTTEPTNGDVIATVSDPSEPIIVIDENGVESSPTHTFTKNDTFTFSIKDSYDNRNQIIATVNNIDKTKPVLTLNGESIMNVTQGDTYEDAGANFTDNYDSSYIVYGDIKVDTSTPGTYTIKYNASDRAGNLANGIMRTVNVLEKKISRSSSSGSYIGGYNPVIQNITQTNTEPLVGQVLGAEKYNFTLNLGYGSTGEEVLELQKLLNLAGYKSGPEDGIFGPITKGAVIRFQIANGLTGDGIIGPLSREKLNK